VEDPRLARRELRSVRAWIAPELLDPGLAQAFAEITALEPCAGVAPDGVAGLATCNPVNGRRLAGSVGLPLPGVSLAVVDAAGRACRPGEPGRLELAGPSVATPGGVLQTDRPVWQDEAGYVHFLEASVPASGRADWHNGATRPATA
jgi:acyl-coenzyme A synthetase/AMP-(fatty) acid ligase